MLNQDNVKNMTGVCKQVRFCNTEPLEEKLCTAIKQSQYDRVKQLLHCGANPNKTFGDLTPMHWAAGQEDKTSSCQIVKLLIKFGGDPNTLSTDGSSPVHVAASWGYKNILQELVENGGDPWLDDGDGYNAWELALSKQHWDVLKYLASYMDEEDGKQGKANVSCTFSGLKDISLLNKANTHFSYCSVPCVDSISYNTSLVTSGNILADDASYSELNDAGYLGTTYMDATETLISSLEISEYSYVDEDFDVSLTERRFPPVLGSKPYDNSILNHAICSLDEDDSIKSEQLFEQLKSCGLNPGPITATTKRVYALKLNQFKNNAPQLDIHEFKYTFELDEFLDSSTALEKFDHKASELDRHFTTHFNLPLAEQRREEGLRKSFNYLLLDPCLTQNILFSSQNQSNLKELFKSFLSAVFYIGKGKQTRPYEHLYEALKLRTSVGSSAKVSTKIAKILKIWEAGQGVVSLQVFQNSLPAEAYSREAAMIDAIGLPNLCNAKRGSYYGLSTSWNSSEKRRWGVHLLAKAFRIFLHEGERQLRPSNL